MSPQPQRIPVQQPIILPPTSIPYDRSVIISTPGDRGDDGPRGPHRPRAPTLGLNELPELEILAQIARLCECGLVVSGSLGSQICESIETGSLTGVVGHPPSLFDSVAPFADIDVIVSDPLKRAQVTELINEYLPVGRFFRWHIRDAVEDLSLRSGRPVDLTPFGILAFGEPIPAPYDAVNGWHLIQPFDPVNEKDEPLEITSRAGTSFNLEWSSDPNLHADGPAAVLALLYIARTYSTALADPVAVRLQDIAGDGAKWPGRREPELWRTILFALIELLYRAIASGVTPLDRLNQALPSAALGRLRRHGADDPALHSILNCYIASLATTSVVTTVTPVLVDGRWRGQITSVEAVPMRRWRDASRGRLTGIDFEQGSPGRVSPLVAVDTGQPPRPGCCRYVDFAKGCVEVAWNDSDPGDGDGRSHLAAMLLPVSKAREYGLAHSYNTFGAVGQMRTDYNFLGVMSGSGGLVDVIAFEGIFE